MTLVEWGLGALANPAWDLVKFLGLRAWDQVDGWQANVVRRVVDQGGLLDSNQADRLRRWLIDTPWATLLDTCDGDDNELLDHLATVLHERAPAGESERAAWREHAAAVAVAIWEPLLGHADMAMLNELNAESRDERVAALVEQVAARCAALDTGVKEWLAIAKRLETDIGL